MKNLFKVSRSGENHPVVDGESSSERPLVSLQRQCALLLEFAARYLLCPCCVPVAFDIHP